MTSPIHRVLFAASAAFAIGFIAACSSRQSDKIDLPLKQEYLDRGRVLVRGLASCGFCHGASADPGAVMSGGRSFTDLYGEALASNITPAKTGLAEWRTQDFLNYFRFGIKGEDEEISQVPHRGMEWLADEDLLSIIGYLKSVAPVESEVSGRSLSFVDRNTVGLIEAKRRVTGFVPQISSRFKVEYGQYLVDSVARCGVCHHSKPGLMSSAGYLTGGQNIITSDGQQVAPDITNSPVYGIGEWGEDQIVSYLQTGIAKDGSRSDPKFCPVGFYRNAELSDLQAIAAFLKTVDPEFDEG